MSEKFKVFIRKLNIFANRRRTNACSPAESETPAQCALSCRSPLRRDCDGAGGEKFNKHFQKKNFLMMAVVVFLIAVSVSIPVHQAQASILGDAVAWGIEAFMNTVSAGGAFFLNFIFAVLVAVLNIGLELAAFLVIFGAWLIDAMLDPRLYVGDPAAAPPVPGVLTSSTITVGWTTVRDMCNTFYVFFLLIIAFGTILRSSTFNAKNLLPKLVISLFLINFSAEITKLVIDFGQVFMYGIMSWMGTFQGGGGTLTSIVDQFKNEIDGAGWQANFDQVVRVAFALLYSVVLGLTYVMLACFLLVRLVAFVLLIILSPIAFLSIVMPSMGKYTSEWWGELVKYSIFGPIFMFFVYLSATMANELVTNFTPLPPPIGGELNPITGIISVMVPHSVALLMLMAVVPVTQRLGVAGAGKIIGGTAGFGKIVMGGYSGAKKSWGFGKKVASETDRRTGGRASDWGRRQKEEILLKLPGGKGKVLKDRAAKEKEKEENIKKIRVEFGEAKNRDIDLMQQKANGKLATNEDKALFAETAAAQGKLGDAKYAGDIKKFMPTIEITLSKKDLEEGIANKSLSMSTQTKEGKKKIAEANSGNYTSFSDETAKKIKSHEITAEDGVKRDKMADIIRDGKAHEVQDLDNASSAKMWDDAQDPDQKKSAISRMAKDQRSQLAKGYMNNTQSEANFGALRTSAVAGNATSKKMLEKDTEFKIDAVNLGKDLEEAFANGGTKAGKDIENAFGRFDSKVVGKFSDKQLETYGHKTTASQWRELNRTNKTKQFEIVMDSKQTKQSSLTKSTDLKSEYMKLENQIDRMNDLLTGEKY